MIAHEISIAPLDLDQVFSYDYFFPLATLPSMIAPFHVVTAGIVKVLESCFNYAASSFVMKQSEFHKFYLIAYNYMVLLDGTLANSENCYSINSSQVLADVIYLSNYNLKFLEKIIKNSKEISKIFGSFSKIPHENSFSAKRFQEIALASIHDNQSLLTQMAQIISLIDSCLLSLKASMNISSSTLKTSALLSFLSKQDFTSFSPRSKLQSRRYKIPSEIEKSILSLDSQWPLVEEKNPLDASNLIDRNGYSESQSVKLCDLCKNTMPNHLYSLHDITLDSESTEILCTILNYRTMSCSWNDLIKLSLRLPNCSHRVITEGYNTEICFGNSYFWINASLLDLDVPLLRLKEFTRILKSSFSITLESLFTQWTKIEQVFKAKKAFEAEEVFEAGEVLEAEQVFEPEKAFEAEEVFEPEKAFGAEEVFEPEQVFEAEQAFEAEQVFEPEKAFKAKKAFEAEQVFEAEEVFEPEKGLEAEKAFAAKKAFEAEQVFESEKVLEVEDSVLIKQTKTDEQTDELLPSIEIQESKLEYVVPIESDNPPIAYVVEEVTAKVEEGPVNERNQVEDLKAPPEESFKKCKSQVGIPLFSKSFSSFKNYYQGSTVKLSAKPLSPIQSFTLPILQKPFRVASIESFVSDEDSIKSIELAIVKKKANIDFKHMLSIYSIAMGKREIKVALSKFMDGKSTLHENSSSQFLSSIQKDVESLKDDDLHLFHSIALRIAIWKEFQHSNAEFRNEPAENESPFLLLLDQCLSTLPHYSTTLTLMAKMFLNSFPHIASSTKRLYDPRFLDDFKMSLQYEYHSPSAIFNDLWVENSSFASFNANLAVSNFVEFYSTNDLRSLLQSSFVSSVSSYFCLLKKKGSILSKSLLIADLTFISDFAKKKIIPLLPNFFASVLESTSVLSLKEAFQLSASLSMIASSMESSIEFDYYLQLFSSIEIILASHGSRSTKNSCFSKYLASGSSDCISGYSRKSSKNFELVPLSSFSISVLNSKKFKKSKFISLQKYCSSSTGKSAKLFSPIKKTFVHFSAKLMNSMCRLFQTAPILTSSVWFILSELGLPLNQKTFISHQKIIVDGKEFYLQFPKITAIPISCSITTIHVFKDILVALGITYETPILEINK